MRILISWQYITTSIVFRRSTQLQRNNLPLTYQTRIRRYPALFFHSFPFSDLVKLKSEDEQQNPTLYRTQNPNQWGFSEQAPRVIWRIHSINTIFYLKKKKKIYMKNSVPARTPEAPAFFKPFFLTMKLAPMKMLDERARTRPLMLSEDIPSRQLVGRLREVVEDMTNE